MKRRSILSLVLAFVFAMSLAGAAFATEAAVLEPGSGTPASADQITATKNTLDVWASRISRHDPRALDMSSEDVEKVLFRTSGKEELVKALDMRYPTSIVDVTDVKILDDGTFTAQVSFNGFYTQYGYQTAKFTLQDTGNKYLEMASVEFQPVVFPDGVKPAMLSLEFATDGVATLSKASVTLKTGFLQITVTNKSAAYKVLVIVAKGGDPMDMTTLVQVGYFVPDGKDVMVMSGLPKGQYDVYDVDQTAILVNTLTVK